MIRMGQIGVKLTLTLKEVAADGSVSAMNVSSAVGASDKQLRILRPNGTVLVKDAAFVTDGTDGKIRVTTDSTTDLDSAGVYKVQAYIKVTGFEGIVGDEGEFEFTVRRNFTDLS